MNEPDCTPACTVSAVVFDAFVEDRCSLFYAGNVGRPGVAPGVYFRILMIGFFEGLDSERGIARRVADSLSLRHFLGYELDQATPAHSSVSRTRRLMDYQTHQEVFAWVLKVLAKTKLLKGKTLGVDATTLDANAAMRSSVRRDSGESYDEFLTELARASGIETPTLPWTRLQTELNLENVSQDPEAKKRLHDNPSSEVVADKGYHSNEVLVNLSASGIRSCISEPDRGRRRWKSKADARQAVYASRRRIRGNRGQALRRKRGEFLERAFAHLFETGGRRRLFLRGRQNILKRLLIHVCGFNLGLLMRKLVGSGTPRGLKGVFFLIGSFLRRIWSRFQTPLGRLRLNS